MRVLITGATGFVGSRLIASNGASNRSIEFRAVTRRSSSEFIRGVEVISVPGISADTNWADALVNVDVVIHLAARVHVMDDVSVDPLAEYRLVNVQGTLNLARQAARAGVRRFIFLSSIKVNGEGTNPGECFSENSRPKPEDPYGVSKYEAEEGLKEICDQAGMEFVIIRPPLIYGPGVKANYLKLVQVVQKGFPLPFGCINNKRSMLALDNLIDFILLVSDHPRAANQTFLLSDGQDLSSKELVAKIALAVGSASWILPVPVIFLKVLGVLLGRRSAIDRLIGSLQIDSSKARELLGWSPPVSIDEGISRTVHSTIAKERK